MTVALGYTASCGCVYLSADTLTLSGYDKKPASKKIIEISENSAVVVSGLARTAALIEHHKGRLAKAADRSGFDFSLEYRKMIQEDGYERDGGVPTWSHGDSSVLMASKSGLYLLDSSMHVLKAGAGVAYGIGCGGAYAMSAMAVYQQIGLTHVPTALVAACKVACRYSVGCGGEIDVWRVGPSSGGRFLTHYFGTRSGDGP